MGITTALEPWASTTIEHKCHLVGTSSPEQDDCIDLIDLEARH